MPKVATRRVKERLTLRLQTAQNDNTRVTIINPPCAGCTTRILNRGVKKAYGKVPGIFGGKICCFVLDTEEETKPCLSCAVAHETCCTVGDALAEAAKQLYDSYSAAYDAKQGGSPGATEASLFEVYAARIKEHPDPDNVLKMRRQPPNNNGDQTDGSEPGSSNAAVAQ